MPILHYIYDPLCGWCYGASPLLAAARGVAGLQIRLHGGGLMNGVAVSAGLRDYVMQHDQRIAMLTGVPFGSAYFDKLLQDHSAVFSSAPPITAILAAEEVAGRGLDMLARLQMAHYVEGRRISEESVLLELGADIGLPEEPLRAAFYSLHGARTAAHIADSRALLEKHGGRGFPAFILETSTDSHLLDTHRWLSDPEGFSALLAQL
ncbi:disulfide reductase DsbM [Uliginosibacterium flavum]|uniref:DsbA family protein n=1 Tax=Uliginosibacterium flavum TaxID=1396831 RepID=A0ABV2TPK3_9RHOO